MLQREDGTISFTKRIRVERRDLSSVELARSRLIIAKWLFPHPFFKVVLGKSHSSFMYPSG
jgi:hypothetical protein